MRTTTWAMIGSMAIGAGFYGTAQGVTLTAIGGDTATIVDTGGAGNGGSEISSWTVGGQNHGSSSYFYSVNGSSLARIDSLTRVQSNPSSAGPFGDFMRIQYSSGGQTAPSPFLIEVAYDISANNLPVEILVKSDDNNTSPLTFSIVEVSNLALGGGAGDDIVSLAPDKSGFVQFDSNWNFTESYNVGFNAASATSLSAAGTTVTSTFDFTLNSDGIGDTLDDELILQFNRTLVPGALPTDSVIPEPVTPVLALMGLAALGLAGNRRRR